LVIGELLTLKSQRYSDQTQYREQYDFLQKYRWWVISQSIVLKGAECSLYIGGKLYPEAQSISYTVDYGQDFIYGIDSFFPQEIAITKVSVQGSVSGIFVKLSGGLQGHDALTKINQKLFAPYVSFEIRERQSDTKIIFIPQCVVSAETMSIQAKGTVKLSFTFKGIIPYSPVDMS